MKFLPLLAIAFLSGCQTHYTKFNVTDYQGNRVATWIAEGSYYPSDYGYKINAVERTSGPPHVMTNHYPNGWATRVVGPNITHEKVEKPAWLVDLDGK